MAARDARVLGIQFSRNFGQHYGITAGRDYCNGDWEVVMDCDLQDRPEEISRFYAKAQEGYEIVLARRGNRQDPFLKRCTSWLFYELFSYLADIKFEAHTENSASCRKRWPIATVGYANGCVSSVVWCNGWVSLLLASKLNMPSAPRGA